MILLVNSSKLFYLRILYNLYRFLSFYFYSLIDFIIDFGNLLLTITPKICGILNITCKLKIRHNLFLQNVLLDRI
jgi:hypothetical protein